MIKLYQFASRNGLLNLCSLKDYLQDDQPIRIDSCVFLFVASVIKAAVDYPLTEYANTHANLSRYNQRMFEEYFPELIRQ